MNKKRYYDNNDSKNKVSDNNTGKNKVSHNNDGKDKVLGLNKIYKNFNSDTGEIKVVDGISINLCPNEIVALVGPSGCGKTTLLNIAAGLLRADSGDVFLAEGNSLAYIFQEPRLLPWKTVEGNIRFVQENFLSSGEAEELREELLARVGLLDFKKSYPAQLSGGMKQRLEIIRALSIQPNLVLMDEPFKSLDISLKYQVQRLLIEEREEKGFAMFFITHDPEDAVLMADRVIILSEKPSSVIKVLEIDIPLKERSLKNNQIYNSLQEILGFIL